MKTPIEEHLYLQSVILSGAHDTAMEALFFGKFETAVRAISQARQEAGAIIAGTHPADVNEGLHQMEEDALLLIGTRDGLSLKDLYKNGQEGRDRIIAYWRSQESTSLH